MCFVIGCYLFPRPTAVPTPLRTCVDLQLSISAIETPACCIRSPWTSESGAVLDECLCHSIYKEAKLYQTVELRCIWQIRFAGLSILKTLPCVSVQRIGIVDCATYVHEFTCQDVCFSHSRLVPGAQYYYVFGDTYGWSEEHSFRATPKPGASVTSKIIAYGGRERGESEREVDY